MCLSSRLLSFNSCHTYYMATFFYWLLFSMSIFLNVPIPQNPLSSHALLFNVPFSHGHPLQISLLSFLQSPISSMFRFLPWPFYSMYLFFHGHFLQRPLSSVSHFHHAVSSMSPFLNVSFLQCLLCSIFLFLNVPFQSTALALYYLILLRYLTKPLWTDIAPTNICTGNISLLFTVLFVV